MTLEEKFKEEGVNPEKFKREAMACIGRLKNLEHEYLTKVVTVANKLFDENEKLKEENKKLREESIRLREESIRLINALIEVKNDAEYERIVNALQRTTETGIKKEPCKHCKKYWNWRKRRNW